MPTQPQIWCDLDGTLVWTLDTGFEAFVSKYVPRSSGIRTPGRKRLLRVPFGTGELRACIRRGSHELLMALRAKSDVRMLTSATSEYAEAMNDFFKLGFRHHEICAREEWYGKRLKLGDGPQVLVDNEHDTYCFRLKQEYLGGCRLVRVSDFSGGSHQDWTRAEVRRIAKEALEARHMIFTTGTSVRPFQTRH
jgi:hypothetical protein